MRLASFHKQRPDHYGTFKSVVLLLFGFYLGGLHSSIYVSHNNNNSLRPPVTREANNNRRRVLDKQSDDALQQSEQQETPTVATLRQQIESLQQDLRQCESEKDQDDDKQQPADALPQQAAAAILNNPPPTFPTSNHPFCQRFPALQHSHPLHLWLSHAPQIHQASQLLPNDPRYNFHDYTAQILQLISPRLPQAIVQLPSAKYWPVVDRILNKIVARLDYLQQQQSQPQQPTFQPPPPPIKIIVLGGSILIGRNCRKLVTDLGMQMRMPNRECTYSNRIQKFLDALEPQLFQVFKIAMGGTNTAVGSQIFDFDLLPDEARDADIVINGYATNDMHVLSVLEAQANNATLGQYVFNMTQEFVRNVLQDNPCREKPLLIHLDDYLGNEQREILSTMELSQAVGALADYYGFNRISYANMVRDIVYGDTKEYWFSPEGWYPKGAKGMEREIHPGMGMHIVSAWMIAYDFLTMATTFCSMQGLLESDSVPADYDSTKFASLVPLKEGMYKGKYTNIPGKPMEPPRSLPPPLTPSLNLEHVSDTWRRQSAAVAQTCDIHVPRKRCIFSWISGLSQQQKNMTHIEQMFQEHTTSSRGWKLVDENDKIGYMPTKKGDKTILEFTNLLQPIQSVNFFIMKSYGEKWKDSRILATVAQKNPQASDWSVVSTLEMSGVHAKNTSEIYPQAIALPNPIPVTSSVQVSYELVGGNTFKLMGLAVCS